MLLAAWVFESEVQRNAFLTRRFFLARRARLNLLIFCKAVVRQTAGRRGATGRQNEEFAHRADDTQQRKGSSRVVPPCF